MLENENKPKILCVDDDPRNLSLLEAILAPRGHEMILVENGQDALAKAVAETPDLILLDIMMPKMSGFDVLQKLRSDERTRLIPVVMVTALRETEDRIKALDAGCDDFISKPFDMVELLARIQSLLKINYYRRQLDEKEKLAAVIEKMSEGVVICSGDWRIKGFNTAAQRYLNITQATNETIFYLMMKEYSAPISLDALLDLSMPQKTFDIVRKETAKAKELCLEASWNLVRNPAGELSSIVFILRDVTQARREEALKQDFLGLISHKLRTPLSIIDGNISLFADGLCGELTKEQKEVIDAMSKWSFALVGLVEKLLGFAIIYSQKLDLSKEVVELKPYLPLVTGQTIKHVKDKKINLDIDCPEGATLSVNKTYFDQILGNLIENAIKFNDKEFINISVAVRQESDRVEISVADNGPGIPSEEYERIFEKFYQIEKTFTGQVEGAGLGLAIVKKLVEGLGGRIQVKSNLAQGATFTFTLPA